MADNSSNVSPARRRAEQLFKMETRDAAVPASVEGGTESLGQKTERLRALRLARQCEDRGAGEKHDTAPSQVAGDPFPDAEQLEKVREAVQRDMSTHERLGIGMRALCNEILFERVPDKFHRLLARLKNRELSGRDPE
jgi:hypothetical protein